MEREMVTKEDLRDFKLELIHEFSVILERLLKPRESKVVEGRLRSKQVRELLNISSSTLQSYRIHGVLKAKKVRGSYFYDRKDLQKFLD